MPPTRSTGCPAFAVHNDRDARESPLVPSAFENIRCRMRLPLIAAPMFLVSGVELVVAACKAGIVGAIPTANCRSTEQLDTWMREIGERLRRQSEATGAVCAPVCPNLIVHRSNVRLDADLRVLLEHRPELVIT